MSLMIQRRLWPCHLVTILVSMTRWTKTIVNE